MEQIRDSIKKIINSIIKINDEEYLKLNFNNQLVYMLENLGYQKTFSEHFTMIRLHKEVEKIQLGNAFLKVTSEIVMSGIVNASYHMFVSEVVFEEVEDYTVDRDSIYETHASPHNYLQHDYNDNILSIIKNESTLVLESELIIVVEGDYDHKGLFFHGVPTVYSIIFTNYRELDE
jgi:hypothetical protein